MYQVIIVVHVFLGLGVIGLVLMQQGKGADAGAAFGSGGSGSVFGAQGAASFLSRTTAILAALFFSTSLGLAILSGTQSENKDLMDVPEIEQPLADVPVIGNATATPDSAPVIPDTPVIADTPVVPETPAVIEATPVTEAPATTVEPEIKVEETTVAPAANEVIEAAQPEVVAPTPTTEEAAAPVVEETVEKTTELAPTSEVIPDKEVVVGE